MAERPLSRTPSKLWSRGRVIQRPRDPALMLPDMPEPSGGQQQHEGSRRKIERMGGQVKHAERQYFTCGLRGYRTTQCMDIIINIIININIIIDIIIIIDIDIGDGLGSALWSGDCWSM